MKELKFRVWEEREKAYNTWSYILDTIGNLFRNAYGALVGCDKKDYIVEQCTGLKDKNGKEIYEGDILWWEHFYGMTGENIETTAKVYWEEKDASFVVGDWFEPLGHLVDEDEVYIIGNVHENLELLEDKE